MRGLDTDPVVGVLSLAAVNSDASMQGVIGRAYTNLERMFAGEHHPEGPLGGLAN